MFDRDRVFAECVLFSLIGGMAAMLMGTGPMTLVAVLVALCVVYNFLQRLP